MIRDCSICLVPHEDSAATHAAMESVRDWLKRRVLRAIGPVEAGTPGERIMQPNVGLVPRKIKASCKLCGEPAKAKRLCMTHYLQQRREVLTADDPRRRAFKPGEKAWNYKGVTNEQIRALRAVGLSYAKIAKEVGMNQATVYERLNGRPGIGARREASA